MWESKKGKIARTRNIIIGILFLVYTSPRKAENEKENIENENRYRRNENKNVSLTFW